MDITDETVKQLATAIERLAAAVERTTGMASHAGGIQVTHVGLPRCWRLLSILCHAVIRRPNVYCPYLRLRHLELSHPASRILRLILSNREHMDGSGHRMLTGFRGPWISGPYQPGRSRETGMRSRIAGRPMIMTSGGTQC